MQAGPGLLSLHITGYANSPNTFPTQIFFPLRAQVPMPAGWGYHGLGIQRRRPDRVCLCCRPGVGFLAMTFRVVPAVMVPLFVMAGDLSAAPADDSRKNDGAPDVSARQAGAAVEHALTFLEK